jgi:hypothetical protein
MYLTLQLNGGAEAASAGLKTWMLMPTYFTTHNTKDCSSPAAAFSKLGAASWRVFPRLSSRNYLCAING